MRRTGHLSATAALAVLIAGAVAFLGMEGSAGAAFPGKNGRIAFGVQDSGIHTMSPDGTGQRFVAGEPANDPAWSADATKIAYTGYHYDSDTYQVFVMNRDGSGKEQLTPAGENGEGGQDPSWSPDGKKLVFRYGDWDGNQGLYTMNADGSDKQPLVGAGYYPDWSPDGQRIVFVRYNAGRERPYALCTITPSGADRVCFARQQAFIEDPDFSPDGRKIVYTTGWGDGLDRVKLTEVGAGEGKTLFTVPPETPPARSYLVGACFSPNGKKVAFSMDTPLTDHPWIYKMNLDGTYKTRVTAGFHPDWGPRTTTTAP